MKCLQLALRTYRAHWSNILLAVELCLNCVFFYTGPLYAVDYQSYMQQIASILSADVYDCELPFTFLRCLIDESQTMK
jgi:hypothetical protein